MTSFDAACATHGHRRCRLREGESERESRALGASTAAVASFSVSWNAIIVRICDGSPTMETCCDAGRRFYATWMASSVMLHVTAHPIPEKATTPRRSCKLQVTALRLHARQGAEALCWRGASACRRNDAPSCMERPASSTSTGHRRPRRSTRRSCCTPAALGTRRCAAHSCHAAITSC